ncbi:hypothetical protein C1H46_010761 [Malus baccata]|uniref:Uncharacterized protein n=1 Tax=Malus baccata TaxID=106549 RepID=A0A540MZ68_MALBA|nr:hypothetical protein C1H46_010761 [Malus baccata]
MLEAPPRLTPLASFTATNNHHCLPCTSPFPSSRSLSSMLKAQLQQWQPPLPYFPARFHSAPTWVSLEMLKILSFSSWWFNFNLEFAI